MYLIELVELAKSGDKPAFDEIIRENAPDLFRIAMSILKNKDDADDAVCDTVVKAYENLYKLRDCAFFKTWLIRILINQANTIYKKRKKIVYLSDIPQETRQGQYEDFYHLGDTDLSTAVANLKLEFRTVIVLHYFQDLKVKEIAEALQIPAGTVKWRLSKAKSILQKELLQRREGLENV